MRTVVVTGSAGSGTSSVALGLAYRMVDEGRRTVLLRCDPQSGTAAAVDARRASALPVKDIDPLAWGESTWNAVAIVRRLLGQPWSSMGAHNVLPIPGLTELAWWGVLRETWRGPWDAVVVDAGSVAVAQRWLTLPDTVVGLLRRTWPLADRTGAAAGRLEAGSWHLRAMARLDSEAADLADQLRSGATSVHLVTRPDQHDLGRALSSLAPLALFELPVTDLILNRVSRRRSYDRAVCDRLPAQLPALTIRTAIEHRDPPTPAALGNELYPQLTAGARPPRPRVGRTGEQFSWLWPLPFVDPARVAAVMDGEDLVLTVGPARRIVPLPSVLRRCTLGSATVNGSMLHLQFEPNPDVWPVTRESE